MNRLIETFSKKEYQKNSDYYDWYLKFDHVFKQFEFAKRVLVSFIHNDLLFIIKEYLIRETLSSEHEICWIEEDLNHENQKSLNLKPETLVVVFWAFPFTEYQFLWLSNNAWSHMFIEHLAYSNSMLFEKIYCSDIKMEALSSYTADLLKVTWKEKRTGWLTVEFVDENEKISYWPFATLRVVLQLPMCEFIQQTLETILYGKNLAKYESDSSFKVDLIEFLEKISNQINHQSLLEAYEGLE